MTRWGMVIDLKSCVTCYACMVSCKQEHFLPPGVFWNRLLVKENGKYPNVRKVAYSVLCNHCENAPCVKACPTGATSRRDDGIVVVDSEQCVGCGSCVLACPYQQRTLIEDIDEYFPQQGLTEPEMIGGKVYPHKPGTVVKCVFCAERIDSGLEKNLVPGVDREATPACVNICMTKARTFGDLDDPNSEVSLIIKERNGKPLLADEGTNPSVYYVD